MFRSWMDYYDVDDFVPVKLSITVLMAFVVGFFSIAAFSPYLTTSEPTRHDGFMFLTTGTGLISLFCSFFVYNFLVNFLVACWSYMEELFSSRDEKPPLSFNFETLFDVTLKNPTFYFFSLSLGYIVGMFERFYYVKTLENVAGWETTLPYYFTYVKYPMLVFFFGVLTITLTYFFIAIAEKPLSALLKKTKLGESIGDFVETLIYHARNKSLLMVMFGLYPALLLVVYLIGVFPNSATFSLLIETYLFSVGVCYPVIVAILTIIDKINEAKQFKEEATQDTMEVTIGEDVVKAKQTSYEEISTILISELMEKDIKNCIEEINDIVHEVNPYLKLVEIEEAHVLKRITEEEVVNLLAHYSKLPLEDQEELKDELLMRLHSAKEAAKEIAEISKTYHYEAFKKQSNLMDQRYKEEKDAK